MRTAEQVEELLDRMEALLNEYDSSKDKFDRDNFRARNEEKLGKYADIMKKLNGDNFDIYNASYDELHSDDFKDMDEATYLSRLIEAMDKKLEELKGAFSDITGEDVVEVNAMADDDKTEVEAKNSEGEHVAEATAEETEDKAEEDKAEEEAESDDEKPEAEPDADDMAELERIAKSAKRHY